MDTPEALLFRHPGEYRITGVAGRGAYAVVCRADVVDPSFAQCLEDYQAGASPPSRQTSAQYCSDVVADAPQFGVGESPIQAAQRQASSALVEEEQDVCPGIAGDLSPCAGHFAIYSGNGSDDRPAHRTVAIKRLLDHCSRRRAVPPEFALHYLRKVCREVSILRHFRSVPQIIPILDLYMGTDAEDIYIVMPYVQYTLKRVVQGFALEEPLIKWIVMQLLLGLRALHSCGIIHRDLTLNNVLVDGDTWDTWISDFGLSRARETSDANLTLEVVTLPYRAPEVLMEYGQYTTAVDVWALGCIMAECFLRSPFMHLGENQNPDALKQLRHIMKLVTGFPDLRRTSEFASERNGSFLKTWAAGLEAKGSALPGPTDVGERLQRMQPSLVISDDAVNVLRRMLVLVPSERAGVDELLSMPWFLSDPDCSAVIQQALETQPPEPFDTRLERMDFEELQAGLQSMCQGRVATLESVLRPLQGSQLDLGEGQ